MTTAYAAIKDRRLWAGGDNSDWPLDAVMAAELDARLRAVKPRVIVEVGSGSSTIVLAAYAAWMETEGEPVTVVSLEHDQDAADRTLRLLEEFGLETFAEIHLRPLVPFRQPVHVDGAEILDVSTLGPWYVHADLPSAVDFVLVDGPPERKGGRAAVLPALWDHLAPGAEVWVDDANRPGERAAIHRWATMGLEFMETRLPFGKNGAALLQCKVDAVAPLTDVVDAHDVVLTILTGRRPELLRQTLAGLATYAPGLLETAQVVVMVNGGKDPETMEVLKAAGIAGATLETTSLYGIGRAVSLLEVAARRTGQTYWLHLEDDWAASSLQPGWLDAARAAIKRGSPQVRLRHVGERVLDRHMTTGRPIRWAVPDSEAGLLTAQAHLTFNPFLALNGRLTSVFPTEGEADFMASASQLGLDRGVVQLYPGVFTHLGEGDKSLRTALRRLGKGARL